ncbi:protein translocase subunit SecF [Candidatus Cyanaurora vandensis]|uniref:protein translocase subunit SecF n=1 Tax=Candidatus Cyanaurora vandensis TaxID=2714958 RepID=UPI00257B39E7|nr:protein translocase subunit SecF [Candidatus Cyanaurora vandensis]
MAVDVVGKHKLWLGISGAFVAAGLVAMLWSTITLGSPLRLGIDFTGGTFWQLRFKTATPTLTQVREVLTKKDLGNSIIQLSGKEVLIRAKPLSQEERLAVQAALKQELGDYTLDRIETVGPTLGRELLVNGLLAMFVTLTAIAVYVSIRFQSDFAVFALVAMLHDVIVLSGFFAFLGLVANVEIDSLFVVALLTVVGFSVTDTVVVYDRIRENMKFVSRKKPFAEVVNESVNQTFARSLNTSFTALLSLLALYFFGGVTLKDFSLALIIGFAAGAYSSIFNASILLVIWREYQASQKTKSKPA